MSLFEKIACCAEPYDPERRAYLSALGFWKAAGSAPGTLGAAAVEPRAPGQGEGDHESQMAAAAAAHKPGWLDEWLQKDAAEAASRRVLKSGEPSREMVALEHEWGTTMLVMASGRAGEGGARFFPDFKLSMLRFSPAPVYLVQGSETDPKKRKGPVVIAMNVATSDDRFMRDMHKFLMRRARELAKLSGSDIHIVNAVRPVSNPYPGDLVGLAPQILGERLLRECRQNLLEFASRSGVSAENCHVRDGIPEEVVPEVCRQLNPSCLVMATSGRSGIAGSIIGNVPEAVMQRVSCDVLICPDKCIKYQKMD
ncbi:MAG: universal stress protein [Succinivibrio sp.]